MPLGGILLIALSLISGLSIWSVKREEKKTTRHFTDYAYGAGKPATFEVMACGTAKPDEGKTP